MTSRGAGNAVGKLTSGSMGRPLAPSTQSHTKKTYEQGFVSFVVKGFSLCPSESLEPRIAVKCGRQ
jgi:hypothetical protein